MATWSSKRHRIICGGSKKRAPMLPGGRDIHAGFWKWGAETCLQASTYFPPKSLFKPNSLNSGVTWASSSLEQKKIVLLGLWDGWQAIDFPAVEKTDRIQFSRCKQAEPGWEIVFLQKVTLWDAEVIDFGVGKEVSDNQLTLYLP